MEEFKIEELSEEDFADIELGPENQFPVNYLAAMAKRARDKLTGGRKGINRKKGIVGKQEKKKVCDSSDQIEESNKKKDCEEKRELSDTDEYYLFGYEEVKKKKRTIASTNGKGIEEKPAETMVRKRSYNRWDYGPDSDSDTDEYYLLDYEEVKKKKRMITSTNGNGVEEKPTETVIKTSSSSYKRWDHRPSSDLPSQYSTPEDILKKERLLKKKSTAGGINIQEPSETVIKRSSSSYKRWDREPSSDIPPHSNREDISMSERLLKKPMARTTNDQELDEQKEMKKIQKLIKKSEVVEVGQSSNHPTSELPRKFMEKLEEVGEGKPITELKLVLQKELCNTDLSSTHNRLSIPISRISNEFLSEVETAHLKIHNGKNWNAVEANVIEPSCETGKVSVRRWVMTKTKGPPSITYNLTTTWKNIASRNSLRKGQVLQVWSVRVDGELWLILVRVPKVVGPSDEPETSSLSSSEEKEDHGSSDQ